MAGLYVGAEDILKGFHFGGVADLGGGAVGFHEIHFSRPVIHLRESVLNGVFLPFGVRGGDAFAFPVGGSAHGIYKGVYPVPVALGVGAALEYINRHGFRHYESVGPGIKGVRAVG